ncbi:FAP73_1 [Blepharisma stoltei]|uniref:DUF4200 domain-containing protein n=1 Tax=Blepharisma stoltei TaxID=1481888 RepID=A0AAU9IV90_9CILI|nr:unnamed protein product [Blepharisma stoltei]
MKGTKYNLKQLKMDTVSPATRLLDKRRLMYQVQEAFERQKEEENRRLEIFNSKEEELRARDLAVQEKFVEFSKVINENEAKLQRAKNRIEEEKKAIEAKQKKKEELEAKVVQLKEKAGSLEAQVQSMKRYEEFLEKVRLKNPEEFTDINDILNLHTKLINANNQLKQQQKELEEENQKIRTMRDQLEKKKKDEIMQLNIEIAQLSKQYEDVDSKRLDLTKQVDVNSALATEKQVEIGHIFMAIDNLYRRCKEGPNINHYKNLKVQPASKGDDMNSKSSEVVEKLKIIEAYLADFKTIVDQAPKHLIQNTKTAKYVFKYLVKDVQASYINE